MSKNGLLIALYVVGCLNVSVTAGAGESPPLRKIRAAITSISGSMVPPWAAHEAGIFRKHGLQVEVIAMPAGSRDQRADRGRSSLRTDCRGNTAGAAAGGADVKIVATTVGTCC